MFTINLEDGREAPYKASTLKRQKIHKDLHDASKHQNTPNSLLPLQFSILLSNRLRSPDSQYSIHKLTRQTNCIRVMEI